MEDQIIDFGRLVDEAMHTIVQKALGILENNISIGQHHFFISFLTNFPGVVLSKKLKALHPVEMTIVLQYQFENLKVEEDKFSVTLSFNSVRENITVPFEAMTAFADPSVKFGLQFRHLGDEFSLNEEEAQVGPICIDQVQTKKKGPTTKTKKEATTGNVISMDSFRKTSPQN
jgi:uncharacterized protein